AHRGRYAHAVARGAAGSGETGVFSADAGNSIRRPGTPGTNVIACAGGRPVRFVRQKISAERLDLQVCGRYTSAAAWIPRTSARRTRRESPAPAVARRRGREPPTLTKSSPGQRAGCSPGQ